MPTRRSELETKILRRQTAFYIKDAPTTVRLIPHPETRTAAGGKTRTPGIPRKPQTFRLVPLDRNASATANVQAGRPADGDMHQANFEIMGNPDLEVERGDKWVDEADGTEYEVVEVQPLGSAPYLRRAFVRGVPNG
jgi:hypothetical protein